MSPDDLRTSPGEQLSFGGFVRPLELTDLPELQPILEHWVVDRDSKHPLPKEVAADLLQMRESIEVGNEFQYFTAVGPNNNVVGVIGMRTPPESKLLTLPFLETNNPVELVNAYVAPDQRGGKGVGRALVSTLEQTAIAQGYDQVVLSSGPRYKDTGWGFYDRLEGYRRVGIAVGLFGPGGDAQVWKKDLTK